MQVEMRESTKITENYNRLLLTKQMKGIINKLVKI